MEIILTPQESEDIFHNALCNGRSIFVGHGLDISYKKDDYDSARRNLKEQNPNGIICYEDVLLQILKEGGELQCIDEEGEGEYTKTITLNDIHTKVCKTPPYNIISIMNETDDADDADAILQTVFFDETVFG